ncbi:DAPG hydrolase family protein [Sodalis ligni]
MNPAPLRLEMGVTHTSDSRLVVAVRTDLQGCTGEMLDWWFRFLYNRTF